MRTIKYDTINKIPGNAPGEVLRIASVHFFAATRGEKRINKVIISTVKYVGRLPGDALLKITNEVR
jgi:hypothetical protein